MAVTAARVVSAAHHVVLTVTVEADHASLLVDIRGQTMVFNAVGAQVIGVGEIGGPVFFIEIVLVETVVVKADVVSIMAGETPVIIGLSAEKMTLQLTVAEGKVTGSAAKAMGNGGEIVTSVIDMAAQTATGEKILDELNLGLRRGVG